MNRTEKYFRPHPTSQVPLPLNVRSVGHYQLTPGISTHREAGTFTQLFWTIEGQGRARVGRHWLTLPPHTVFFYYPGERHLLTANEHEWSYRWMTMDGPQGLTLPAMFGLNRVQQTGHCPEALFEQIKHCFRDATPFGEREASKAGYSILLQASAMPSPHPQENLAYQIRKILDTRFRDPNLNISLLAAEMQIHRSTLYRLFIQQFGVSPIQYLTRIRLGHALEQLKDLKLAVADVAWQAGLPDATYFTKLVKKTTGQTPRQLRAN